MKTLSVLLVEDETIVAMDLEERISRMGYQPTGRALSGQQAIELTAQLRPDVVVMDIRLQGEMDGITAAGEIYHQFAAPVIFLTAHSEDETLARAKLVSPYSYLIKPIKDSDLKSAIEISYHKYGADREINRLNRLLNVLSQVNKTVLHCCTREQLFTDACRLLVERGQIDLAWIGWRDPATARLTPVASYSRVNGAREFLQGAALWADDRLERQGNPDRAVREGQSFFYNECGKGICPYSSERKPLLLRVSVLRLVSPSFSRGGGWCDQPVRVGAGFFSARRARVDGGGGVEHFLRARQDRGGSGTGPGGRGTAQHERETHSDGGPA